MIVRTLERAALAGCFESIVCATDSEEIARVVTAAGFRAVMTGPAATVFEGEIDATSCAPDEVPHVVDPNW